MPERIIEPLEPSGQLPLTHEELAANLAHTEAFVRDTGPHLGRLFGIDLKFKIAQLQEGAGMAAIQSGPDKGALVVDPRFFLKAGHGSPDFASYGILHETAAHLRTILFNPKHAEEVVKFTSQSKANHIFNNVFEDIAGNRLIHAMLPRMGRVAADFYSQQLFPEDDLSGKPRHLQFLFKLLRQEMIPDSETVVSPEVDQAIDSLRDFQGQGDLIAYSTAPSKSRTSVMSPEERFGIWRTHVYPVYQQLLEQDRQDPGRQDRPGGSSQPGESGESQPGESGEDNQENQDNQPQANDSGEDSDEQQEQADDEASDGALGSSEENQDQDDEEQSDGDDQRSDEERFGSYYEDYQQRHSEPMNEEEEERFRQEFQEQMQQQAEANDPQLQQRRREQARAAEFQEQTGHTLAEQAQYRDEVRQWLPAIREMRDVFQQVINERIDLKRGLSRRPTPEGAVLDPDRLPQTYIDTRAGMPDPDAFRDYVKRHGETESFGQTDYVFFFDVSTSMEGQKAEAAAAAALIGLEGLAAMQHDIKQAEAASGIELDLDIRTAIYTFGEQATLLKKLSAGLTEKERLDAYSKTRRPSENDTKDYLALEAVTQLEVNDRRRQILIVVSDGDSRDPERAKRAIKALRGKGWFVYGISIGSDAAEELYKPTAKYIEDPAELPATIQGFIEATIR